MFLAKAIGMTEFLISKLSLPKLLRELGDDLKSFIKEEFALAGAEMKEKGAFYGRGALILAISGFAACAGLTVLVAGMGLLLAFAFEAAGLDRLPATFLGLTIIGILVTAITAIVALKTIKNLKEKPLAPQKTIDAAKHPSDARSPGPAQSSTDTDAPESTRLQKSAMDKKEKVGRDLKELKHRATFGYLQKKAVEHIKNHPVAWGASALAGLAVGSYFGIRRLRTLWK